MKRTALLIEHRCVLLLILLMGLFVSVFAQDATPPATGTPGVSTTTATPPVMPPATTPANSAELIEARKEIDKIKKELEDQKTAAELAKLNEADRNKALLENEKKSLESERQKLNLDKNTVFAKSVLLSEKVAIGVDFLPHLNIKATDTEADITTRATNLKSALDAYVKKFIDDKTAGFDPAKKAVGGKDDITAYATKLAGNVAGEVKDNPYFKL